MNHSVTVLFRFTLPALAVMLFLAVLSSSILAVSGGKNALAAEKPLTSVYVFDNADVDYREADAPYIDQMFFSFALFQNGHVSGEHWESIAAFRQYVSAHPNIMPILSVGGWGADGFWQAAATPEGRAGFVADTLSLMDANGFLGVDIDWEYPCSSEAGIASSPDDYGNYTLLLKALKEGLTQLTAQDGKTRRLCIALSGSPSRIASINCAAVGAIVDQVNLMTYDMQDDSVASLHTALFSASDAQLSADACVQAYIAAGIPKNKLMLGVAFYGHRWTTKADAPLGMAAHKVDTLAYTDIAVLAQANPSAVHFDNVAQAPWYFDGHTFISYDDARSIAQKRSYATDHALLGLFAWEYGADETGTLLRAMQP